MRALPLSSLHRAAGAALAETNGVERVESYGDPSSLARAARTGVGLLDLSHRGRLAVVGPDRESWLQGMVTADVKKLEVGAGCAATVVTVKGKLVAALRIFKRPDELWIDLDAERVTPTLDHLRRYIVMEECELVDRSAETAMLSLHGPRARTLLGAPQLAEHQQAKLEIGGEEVLAIGSAELGVEGLDLWLTPGACSAVWKALLTAGGTPLGFDAAEILRIEAGRPRFGAELDEDTLPLEAGLERAISYDKGCYVGQEVIARIAHRGHVNRKLAGLWISGDAPAPAGATLSQDGKPAGAVRSSLVSEKLGAPIALAYVRRESLSAGTVLSLPDGRTATVTTLPFGPRVA
jgi:folate-binding protein YgfZ